ncbi:hypothetical protein Tco_0013804 [Tanacetum coccineum]
MVDTMQVNVQFLQQLQPKWSRFVTNVKKAQDLDTTSYHKLFDILKQHQNEVNEIQAERIKRNANPLALVAATQNYPYDYYQAPKPYKTNAPSSRQTTSTREEDTDKEQAQRDKQIKKSLPLIAKHFKNIYKPTNNNLRTSSNTMNKNVDTSPRTRNDKQTRQFGNQRAVIVAGKGET